MWNNPTETAPDLVELHAMNSEMLQHHHDDTVRNWGLAALPLSSFKTENTIKKYVLINPLFIGGLMMMMVMMLRHI